MQEYNERKWWLIDWLCWEYYGTLSALIKAFFKGCQLMHPVRLLFLLFLVVFEKNKVKHKKYEIWTRSRYEGGKKEKKNWYHLPVKWNKQQKKKQMKIARATQFWPKLTPPTKATLHREFSNQFTNYYLIFLSLSLK